MVRMHITSVFESYCIGSATQTGHMLASLGLGRPCGAIADRGVDGAAGGVACRAKLLAQLVQSVLRVGGGCESRVGLWVDGRVAASLKMMTVGEDKTGFKLPTDA